MPRSAEEDGEEHDHHRADGDGFVAEDVSNHGWDLLGWAG
jgi:hypothetical protein